MTKRNRIIYWIATIWLALGMSATGFVQLLKTKEGQGGAAMLIHLGYPAYLLTLLGVCKILGVIAVLVPKLPLLKEWAYAGFFFAMSGAVVAHMATGYMDKVYGAALLLLLTVLSWYLRPASRKIISANAGV